MLREDENRPHRITVLYVRSLIKGCVACQMGEQIADLATLDKAHEAHIRARTAFATSETDATMINMIGTWARLTRVIRDMDDKYGVHR